MTLYSAVVTTGIYCRPGCGARPRADNVRTFDSAAAAEAAGFRACLRCRPYRLAGSPPWREPELVCRAVRLIIDGVLDAGTEDELGQQLGLSGRHLRRLFRGHLGMTPDQEALAAAAPDLPPALAAAARAVAAPAHTVRTRGLVDMA
ncbi:Ada metal-binding domain-containing protein [Dactylosporangium sp. CA-139066]|uniref:Ada metal-binding domain-containing protein n=1 Tax=Dactylosporangium sp. CA-139066 TaxID=3239930 RepID=UPI003D8BD17B